MVFGAMYRDEVSGYEKPLICLNGHILANSLDRYPEKEAPFCEICGEKTTSNCIECAKLIRGYHHIPGVSGSTDFELPLYCHNCGKPYEWTKRKIAAAKEYTDLLELNKEEGTQLKKDIESITRDTPEGQVAAARLRKTLAGISTPVAKSLRDMVVDIASETLKKVIEGK